MSWPVLRHEVSARAAHQLVLGGPHRELHVFEPPSAALVLGSSQSDAQVDYAECERLGVDVVRRKSGGGAVLLIPGRMVWIDFWLPRGDALWHDDVGRAMWWVGELWCGVLGDLGVDAHTHRAPMVKPSIAELCFTGIGPGEVLAADGRKLVGVSARRGREGARFQTLAHCEAAGTAWVTLLGLPPAAGAALEAAMQPLPVAARDLTDALLALV